MLRERETYVLKGARTSPNGEVRESKHAVEPGANSTGPCGRLQGRQDLSKRTDVLSIPRKGAQRGVMYMYDSF